jgi:outer membrane lipoprotein-sorting protein
MIALLASVLLAQPAERIVYVVDTVAGTGKREFTGDNQPANKSGLNRPCAVDVDAQGNIYIADYSNSRIRKIDASGTITTIAGTGTPGFAGDGGPATAAQLGNPYGVKVAPDGTIWICDSTNSRIRKISKDGTINTVAGSGQRSHGPGIGDGGPALQAILAHPIDLAFDRAGNYYICEGGGDRVRKVTKDGTITTFAGGGRRRYNGDGFLAPDGTKATEVALEVPGAICFDAKGDMLIADLQMHAVRRVTPDGKMYNVGGTGVRGFNSDFIPAKEAHMNEPGGIISMPDGSIVVMDGVNYRVRRINTDGTIETIAGNGTRGYSGDGGLALEAQFNVIDIACIDKAGNIYLADHQNNAVRRLKPVPISQVRPKDEVQALLFDMRMAYRDLKTAKLTAYSQAPRGGTLMKRRSTIQFANPRKISAQISVEGYQPVQVWLDGRDITIQDPMLTEKVVTKPAEDRTINDTILGNLELFCLWQADQQLSTTANMAGSNLKIERNVNWNGKPWTVLVEATPTIEARYYIDPKTNLMWRTTIKNLEAGMETYDGWLESLEMNPSLPKDFFKARG